MALLCPNCMGELVAIDGERVRCTLDGRTYRVLCCRYQLTPETARAENRVQADAPAGRGTVSEPTEKVATQCSHCGQRYNVQKSLIGREVKCKNCASNFIIAAQIGRAHV